ncbi:MAG: hypothetical protein FJZ01_14860 [Candidatus Sericytochromatia bacterium]|nr:hypothetical protein [Candidatus Tanganyikabacteria bacterium]
MLHPCEWCGNDVAGRPEKLRDYLAARGVSLQVEADPDGGRRVRLAGRRKATDAIGPSLLAWIRFWEPELAALVLAGKEGGRP